MTSAGGVAAAHAQSSSSASSLQFDATRWKVTHPAERRGRSPVSSADSPLGAPSNRTVALVVPVLTHVAYGEFLVERCEDPGCPSGRGLNRLPPVPSIAWRQTLLSHGGGFGAPPRFLQRERTPTAPVARRAALARASRNSVGAVFIPWRPSSSAGTAAFPDE